MRNNNNIMDPLIVNKTNCMLIFYGRMSAWETQIDYSLLFVFEDRPWSMDMELMQKFEYWAGKDIWSRICVIYSFSLQWGYLAKGWPHWHRVLYFSLACLVYKGRPICNPCWCFAVVLRYCLTLCPSQQRVKLLRPLIMCRQPEDNALPSLQHIKSVMLYSMKAASSRDMMHICSQYYNRPFLAGFTSKNFSFLVGNRNPFKSHPLHKCLNFIPVIYFTFSMRYVGGIGAVTACSSVVS